ncbi:MAG: SDR family NAD(P)-dependent oxidoreductase [Cyclobacteriaceae bacterium]
MNKGLKGQVAIVTGAASGLGLAIARALSAEGVKLALLDLNESSLASLKGTFEFESYKTDITAEDEVKKTISKIAGSFGRIDILVNSAGITGKTNLKSHETDTADIEKVFGVNFMGSYYMAKHSIPFMLKNNYGRILHIASIAGKEGNAGMLAYSASKAAVIGMTKVQGKEYAETGITINALAPAVIQTAMVDAMPTEQVKYMTDKIPMKRCGTLEEIAGIAVYIVSSQNSFTTGFTFDLSGGRATY